MALQKEPAPTVSGGSGARDSSDERAILIGDAFGAKLGREHREELIMVDEKKHSETEMGAPASAGETAAQMADEVAMGRPTAPKDIEAQSDAQIAMGQPATAAQAAAQEVDQIALGAPATTDEMAVRKYDDIAMGQPAVLWPDAALERLAAMNDAEYAELLKSHPHRSERGDP